MRRGVEFDDMGVNIEIPGLKAAYQFYPRNANVRNTNPDLSTRLPAGHEKLDATYHYYLYALRLVSLAIHSSPRFSSPRLSFFSSSLFECTSKPRQRS